MTRDINWTKILIVCDQIYAWSLCDGRVEATKTVPEEDFRTCNAIAAKVACRDRREGRGNGGGVM